MVRQVANENMVTLIYLVKDQKIYLVKDLAWLEKYGYFDVSCQRPNQTFHYTHSVTSKRV